MHRFDRTVSAVAFGLGGELGDDECGHQRPAEDDQRNRPGPAEPDRRRSATVADRLRLLVTPEETEQILARVFEGKEEHHRAEAGDDADGNAKDQPLAQVAGVADEDPQAPAGFGRAVLLRLDHQRMLTAGG